MTLFRIAHTEFIDDLTGEGAFLFGGRWNRPGVRVLYSASNLSLSALETLAHMPDEVVLVPDQFSYLRLDLPDHSIYPVATLPATWPAWSNDLWEETDYWLMQDEFLCMRVPSAAVDGEFNFLINPYHELARKGAIKILEKRVFVYDNRLFGRKLII